MKGRLFALYVSVLCCIVFAVAQAAWSEEAASEWSAGLDLAYMSKYVWRGIPVTSESVFQPAVTIGHPRGLSANVWANMDLTDVNGFSGEVNEIDYTLDYSWETGPAALSMGIINYTFPDTGLDSTSEVYLGGGLDAPFSPSATVYYDFDQADGFYINFGTSHSIEMPYDEVASATIDLGVNVGYGSSGYNSFYFGADKSAFTDLLLSMSSTISAGGNVSVTPAVYYSRILDSDLRAAYSRPDNFFAGVTLSLGF